MVKLSFDELSSYAPSGTSYPVFIETGTYKGDTVLEVVKPSP